MAGLLVQYFEYLEPDDKSEVLVSPPEEGIRHNPGLAVALNPEIDCCNGRLTALRAPNGPQRAMILDADWTSPLPEHGELTTRVILLRVYNYSGLPHSIICELVRTWSRDSPYDLANVKGSWEHHGKA